MSLQSLWVHLLLGRAQVWDCVHDDDHEVLQVWEHLPNDRELFLKAEQAFFDEVTQVSGKLFPFPKDERKAQAVKILKGIHVPRKVPLTRITCTNTCHSRFVRTLKLVQAIEGRSIDVQQLSLSMMFPRRIPQS